MARAEARVGTVPWTARLAALVEPGLVLLTDSGLVVGGGFWLLGAREVAAGFWIVATTAAFVPALWWMIATLVRGRVGVDLIAVLSLAGTSGSVSTSRAR